MFSGLTATEQCEKTEEIRQKLAEDILKAADGLPEEDSRLRTFTEVFEKVTADEQNLFLSSEMTKYKQEEKFWELFLWFQPLEANDQWALLEKLDPITPGNVQIPCTKFRIDRFKELPAGAHKIPLTQRDALSITLVSRRSFIPRPDFASAAQLLSRLSTFGFSLLSPCDRKIVAKVGDLYGRFIPYNVQGMEKDITIKSFTELYNAASFDFHCKVYLCKIIAGTFFGERWTREIIFYFRQQGTKEQEEIIDEMLSMLSMSVIYKLDASDAIIEKFSEESEEDFRDRRFINLVVRYPSLWERKLVGAGEWDLGDLHETSRYTKFLNGFANIWAKARCPHDSRNLFQLIVDAIKRVDRKKLIPQGDDIEELPDESMEDFRVRRFTESFNRLQFSSQQYIVEFILDTVFQDVGVPFPRLKGGGYSKVDRPSCVLELIKFKAPNLRGGVVVPPTKV